MVITNTFSLSSLISLTFFLSALLPVFSVQAQTDSGSIDLILYEGEELIADDPESDNKPELDIIDYEALNPNVDNANVMDQTKQEQKIEVNSIGLDFLPDSQVFPEKIITALEQQILAFSQQETMQLSFSELLTLADKLTQTCRNEGYALASVYLPAQRIDNGLVVYQVVLGVLTQVDVVNSHLYSTDLLESVFADELTQVANTSRLEQKLLLIDDLPGLSVSGAFSPAETIGTTQMRVNVKTQEKTEFRFRLDNYIGESTGDIRALVGTSIRNLLGFRDTLEADFLAEIDGGDLTSGSLRYWMVSSNLRHRYGINVSRSDYSTGSSNSNVFGETTLGQLFLNSAWYR